MGTCCRRVSHPQVRQPQRKRALPVTQVEVVQPFQRKTYMFPCGEWLQKSKEAGLDGCKRTLHPGQGGGGNLRVTVHTSDVKGGGTDSDISIVLVGDAGQTEPLKLDSSHNDFERGRVRPFDPCPGIVRRFHSARA